MVGSTEPPITHQEERGLSTNKRFGMQVCH